MGEKIHLFLMLKLGNVALKEIGLGHKNYSFKNIFHFFTENLKCKFPSHCWIWNIYSIVHKHQGPLGYDKSSWHIIHKRFHFSVIIKNKLFYKLKDNMTISYHSIFLLNSTLLFPEYSFYSTQHITFILYLSVHMFTTSKIHSM